ncbi:MAG: type II toxin-antitoxin system VapC family toxin [Chromatiaceae bacterium]|nr:type II toxin-antitoxin system VapC family toxin [Chromatiaceae bacterium]MCF8004634.1 type II toxin-antitoxin system VapC family toxin [Chromatiaceae bacterium]
MGYTVPGTQTSVISYLTARPSKTIVGAAHQQITLAWWGRRADDELVISQLVWRECAAGDPEAAQKRLAALEGMSILAVTEDIMRLGESLIEQRILPAKAIEDALHIAISTYHRVDILLTWNCRHIANPLIQEQVARHLESVGLFLPIICTPEELLGGYDDD